MGGISIWQLLIVAAIVILMFGTKKLRTLGSDLGASIKGFKKAMGDDDKSIVPPAVENHQADADFKADTITAQTAATEQKSAEKTEAQKSQDKEQV